MNLFVVATNIWLFVVAAVLAWAFLVKEEDPRP